MSACEENQSLYVLKSSDAGGNGSNNYPTNLSVTNGSTHTLTIGRSGLGDLTATFDDQTTAGGSGGNMSVLRFGADTGVAYNATNNSLVRILGSGSISTTITSGDIVVGTSLTQYTDILAGAAAASRLQNSTILRNSTAVLFTNLTSTSVNATTVYASSTNLTCAQITNCQSSTTALTTSTSWSGDLTGTGSSPTIASNAVNSAKIVAAAVNSSKLNATNTPSAGQVLTYNSNGQFNWTSVATGTGFEWVNATRGDVTTSSNTVYTRLNLTLSLSANAEYQVSCDIINSAAAATTGVVLNVTVSGASSAEIVWTSMSSATATESFAGTAVTSGGNVFLDTGSNTVDSVGQLDGYVVTGASSVQWIVDVRSEVSASAANIKRGTICRSIRVA